MWMGLESVIQSEVSQKEKNRYCLLMHGAVGEVLNELDLDSWLCPGSQPSTPKSLRLWGTEAAAQLMNPGVKETS